MNGTFEIFTNREWMIMPSFVHGILPTVMSNAQNHSMLGIDREKKSPMCINAAGDDIFRQYEVTDDGTVLPMYDGWEGIDYLKELNQPFVNVLPIDGPITRNGGACSYGSKDIRDFIMKASDNPYCQGHVLIINTHGGSAWAKNDFQQAIEYAHSKGLRVIAFIDGLCASAGMYLAALCDEVYVMNLKDQLGCVGVMASFFTMKNGSKNQFTDETYREYYDPVSVDKNKEMRDIADDEDATLLIEELKELGEEFRADMKASFPDADDDEHLKGKVFDAQDVMGILCDGQMMLGDVIARVFALADGTAQPIGRTADRKIGERAATGSSIASRRTGRNISTTLNTTQMKEKFPALFAALQVEEMQMSEEGAFMNMDLLATLNAHIEAKEKAAADAQALVDSLTQEKENLTKQVEDLNSQVETLNAEHSKAVEDLNAAHATALNEKETDFNSKLEEKDNRISAMEQEKAELQGEVNTKAEQIETLTADLNGAKESLATAEGTIAERDATIVERDAAIAERDQQIADLQAEVKELSEKPTPMVDAVSGIPADNGTGEAPKQKKRITSDMTYEEIRALKKEGK